jgi:hypothetical protein
MATTDTSTSTTASGFQEECVANDAKTTLAAGSCAVNAARRWCVQNVWMTDGKSQFVLWVHGCIEGGIALNHSIRVEYTKMGE